MRQPRGFAMLWALFLVILVGSLGTVVLTRDQTVRRDGARDLEARQSFQAAEAGIEWARVEAPPSGDLEWPGGEIEVGGSTVTVKVVQIAPAFSWDVVCEAKPGGARIEARILDRPGRPVSWWRRTR